jgi:uncharacterized delta-60 repeat protein
VNAFRRLLVLAVLAAATVAPANARAAGGSLDRSFGNRGTVTTDVQNGAFDTAYGIAQQPDGKLVVAGFAETAGGERFLVLRYRADGKLDRTFGTNGHVLTSFGGSFQQARDVAIENGEIVVAGTANVNGRTAFAIARYRADGSLDRAFGDGGRVLTHATGESMDTASSLAVLPSGAIVVAGSTLSPTSAASDFALAKFSSSGTLDAGFGSGGFATVDFSSRSDTAAAIAVTPAGNLVAAGTSALGGSSDFALAELDPSTGAPVTTFGSGGLVRTSFGDATPMPAEALDVAVLAGGKLIACGDAFHGPMVREHDAALARYLPDGTLDPAFGDAGRKLTDVGVRGGDDIATSLIVQPNGKIVTAGTTSVHVWLNDHRFAVTRYRTDGSIDTSFGVHGTAEADFGNGWDLARDVILAGDGGIVVAGEAGARRGGDVALARYRTG